MSAVPIVMINEHRENALEVTRIANEQPIETFGANGPNEAFRDPVRLRYLNRRAHEANAGALKHLIKAACEFAIMIANQEANRFRAVRERPAHLTGLLRDPLLVGMGRAAGKVHTSAGDLDEEEHVQPSKPDRVDSEEVDGDQALRLCVKELTPRWTVTPTRWTQMCLASNLRTVVADATTPRPFSSPTIR